MTVAFAYLHPGQVDAHFHTCLIRMMQYDAAQKRHLGAHIPVTANSGGIAAARNAAVDYYLENCDDEWLFFVDSDMGFAPNTVEALLAAADENERPIVGGLCFCQMEVEHIPDELGVPRSGYWYAPTIYTYREDLGLPQSVGDYPRDALIQCYATGAACILIHRSVFLKIQQEYPGPRSWFDNKIINGQEWSEDIVFCARANTCGFPLFVDTSVQTSHKKPHYLTQATVGDLVGKPVKIESPPEPRKLNRAERRAARRPDAAHIA